jgi:4-diphosphocytidyl-2-C-methyl-D-erythritol kinase
LSEPREGLRISAFAKVNLSLEILGRRDDGFHEIVSVTQTISLHDTIEAHDAPGLVVEMWPPLVTQDANLIARAAAWVSKAARREADASLVVQKRIPLAAGLGGGSSDAAATLRLLDRLWRTDLGHKKLAELAAELGSDVSLFLRGGAALIRGRGEIVEPLPAPPTFWLALACPSFDVPDKTRELYRALDPSEWTDGQATLSLAERLRAGGSILDAALVNTFDGPASRVYPGFTELRSRLSVAAGAPLHLTGAGPSLFALFATWSEAQAAARRMEQPGVKTYAIHSILHRSSIRRYQT